MTCQGCNRGKKDFSQRAENAYIPGKTSLCPSVWPVFPINGAVISNNNDTNRERNKGST